MKFPSSFFGVVSRVSSFLGRVVRWLLSRRQEGFLALSHIVIPTLFLFLAYRAIWTGFVLTWELIATVAIGCLPFILVLAGRYAKRVKIGGAEFETTIAEAEELELSSPPTLQPNSNPGGLSRRLEEARRQIGDARRRMEESLVGGAGMMQERIGELETPRYGLLSRAARKVVRTLWAFQRSEFGENDQRRWGFTIGPPSSDFAYFSSGVAELLSYGLVSENDQGFVFLNNEGIEFCRANRNGLAGGGDMWTTFSPP